MTRSYQSQFISFTTTTTLHTYVLAHAPHLAFSLTLNCAFFTPLVQNNCLVDEQMSSAHCITPLEHCPPLLELAARAIIYHKGTWDGGHLPGHLAAMLSHPSWCSRCKGPLFNYFSSQIKFRTVGVFYRVPLYEQVCTLHPVTCHSHS